MLLTGTPGESITIDWGDGSQDTHVFTGGDQAITHVYAVGQYTQKWALDRTKITRITASQQNMVGALPLALQACVNLTRLIIAANGFTDNLSLNSWPSTFETWAALDILYLDRNANLTGDINDYVSFFANSSVRFFFIYSTSFFGSMSNVDLSTSSLVDFRINSLPNLTGDISNLNPPSSMTRMDATGCDFTGIDGANWSNANFNRLLLNSNLNMSGSIANIGAGAWTNINLLYFLFTDVTGINDLVLDIFNSRATYINNPTVLLQSVNELLTGIYQQPDLGTYTGNIHDLTETEITNLANGNDYDGLGANVSWSTLEKVWVLENLETSSSNSALRYGFSFSYTASVDTVAVTNSGARGQILDLTALANGGGSGATDWINPTDGLAQDWGGGASYDHSIVTGNGFNGNAQRVENPSGFINGNFSQDTIPVGLFTTYRLRFKYRLSSDALGSGYNIQILGATGFTSTTLAQNTGNAKEYTTSPFTSGIGGSIGVYFNNNGTSIGDYIEIDEVELLESSAAATDWVDSNTDGLADNWAETQANSYTPTIKTGDGFFKNAQSLVKIETSGIRKVQQTGVTILANTDYIISCRYRADWTTPSYARIEVTDGTTIESFLLPVNTSNAIVFQSTAFQFPVTSVDINLNVYAGADWLEIDEIELIQV
jgi:hypothetical protein